MTAPATTSVQHASARSLASMLAWLDLAREYATRAAREPSPSQSEFYADMARAALDHARERTGWIVLDNRAHREFVDALAAHYMENPSS